jgi:hypothetical protein
MLMDIYRFQIKLSFLLKAEIYFREEKNYRQMSGDKGSFFCPS